MDKVYAEAIIKNDNIDNAILDFMDFNGKKYIFGNSLQTAVAIGLMRALDIEIAGLILPYTEGLTERKGFWKRMIRSVKSVDIASIPDKNNCYVLIADSQSSYKGNYNYLDSCGFRNLLGCCWKHNSDMLQITCDYYYEKQKGNSVCTEID